jgi:hypothetical protein
MSSRSDAPRTVAETIRGLRRLLLATLTFGIVGVSVELLLIGHTEKRMQLVPLAALGLGFLAIVAWVLVGRRWGVHSLRVTMALFVVTGVLGLYNHYRGNVEFELELYPTIGGWELFYKAITGATPALAPGTMVLLGLVGLAYCYRHPMLQSASPDAPTSEGMEEM